MLLDPISKQKNNLNPKIFKAPDYSRDNTRGKQKLPKPKFEFADSTIYVGYQVQKALVGRCMQKQILDWT